MYALLRTYSKSGYRRQMVLPSKNYSSTHNRSHLLLKYRIESYVKVSGRQLTRSSLLPGQFNVAVASTPDYVCAIQAYFNRNTIRHFRATQCLHEQASSKVEVTVQAIKDKQKEKVEEIMKEAAEVSAAAGGNVDTSNKQIAEEVPKAVVKKSWKTRIWEECLHYYHGFRLLFVDISICIQLVWRVLNGKTLTRRENNLLVRTVSDLFRLIPFSVFIIVPFMELLLPFFIKFFPGMLPSTFQTAKEREDKLRQSLQVKLEMAKFLQKTLDEMAVQHTCHRSEEAKLFDIFFQKIKNPAEYVSSEDIIKFAKRFEDELTLDSLSRQQLAALCRVLEMNSVGNSNLLRFQLRMKLRTLAADDRVIAREGVDSLDLWELQQACKARGMRAYGLTQEKMRTQLQEWIDLSLNEKVPPILLLLSRTIFISDDRLTTHKLKETLRVLPDSLATQTKASIGEREGKIDNKTKLEIIKDEERKIKEEREEAREEAQASKKSEEDKAPIIDPRLEPAMVDRARVISDSEPTRLDPAKPVILSAAEMRTINGKDATKAEEKTLSSEDVELLSSALKNLSSDKKMVVEKETLKDLKEELEEYKEDVEELREVRAVVKEPIRETRAAKVLYNVVDKMIGQLDKAVCDLEKAQEPEAKLSAEERAKAEAFARTKQAEIVRIDELIQGIKNLKQTSDDPEQDECKLRQIESVLSKMDADKDGAIGVDEVLKIVEVIGRENVKLTEKQVEELISLLDKEQVIEAEEKIEKALARSIKEADEAKKMAEEVKNHAAAAKAASTPGKPKGEELIDSAHVVKDNALNLDLTDKNNILATETSISPPLPPPPPPATVSAQVKSKEKAI